MLASLFRHRALVWQLTRRELASRYRGAWLGALWALLTPLGLLVLYAFVFGVVMGVRWQQPGAAQAQEFLAPMFAAMVVYLFVSECIARAPTVVVSQAALIKKVVFPAETLCAATVMAAFAQVVVCMGLLWVWMLLTGRPAGGWFLLALLLWIPIVLFALGATFLLAALGVFVRDISQLTGLINAGLLFLSPVMYPMSAVPESARILLFLNPLTHMVEAVRNPAVFGQTPGLGGVLVVFGLGFIVYSVGAYFFWRSRRAFVDVL
jgi:lipopolysaccharide transport system permease protein